MQTNLAGSIGRKVRGPICLGFLVIVTFTTGCAAPRAYPTVAIVEPAPPPPEPVRFDQARAAAEPPRQAQEEEWSQRATEEQQARRAMEAERARWDQARKESQGERMAEREAAYAAKSAATPPPWTEERGSGLPDDAESAEQPHLRLLTQILESGRNLRRYGDFAAAEELYQNFLDRLGRDAADDPALAVAHNDLAGLYRETGRLRQAETTYLEALRLVSVAVSGEVSTLLPQLRCQTEMDDKYFDKDCSALDYTEVTPELKSMPLIETRQHTIDSSFLSAYKINEGIIRNNLALLYRQLGRYADAEREYDQARWIVEEKLGQEHAETAVVFNNIAMLYDAIGRPGDAEKLYRQALQTLEKVDGREGARTVVVVNNLAGLCALRGELAQAEALSRRALQAVQQATADWTKETGRPHPALALRLYNLAWIEYRRGKFPQAGEHYRTALEITRISGDTQLHWAIEIAYSKLLAAEKKSSAAIFFGKAAVNAIQQLRHNLTDAEQGDQRRFLGTVEDAYRHLGAILVDAGRLAEAQQVIGLLKEQEFFTFVRGATGSETLEVVATTVVEGEVQGRYLQTGETLASLWQERSELEGIDSPDTAQQARLQVVRETLVIAQRQYQQTVGAIGRDLGAKRADKVKELRGTKALTAKLRELGKGTVILYTLVGEEKLRVILMTPDYLKAFESPVKAVELNRMIARFRQVLQPDGTRLADPRPAAQELYQLLLPPGLARELETLQAQTLMWSLDGALRYVPVAALYDGERYLVEKYRNVIFTTESLPNLLNTPQPHWRGLGFGVTLAHGDFRPLPGVEQEIKGVIRTSSSDGAVEGEYFLDGNFTRQTMLAGLQQGYPMVHISSHFALNPGDRSKSFLLLGDGSAYNLEELDLEVSLFGGVELLTLAACNTAVGDESGDGNEVESFGNLAQQLGAEAVVATLWPVADASTSQFFRTFYRFRENKDGVSKAEALQSAQLSLLRGTEIVAVAPGESNRDRIALARPPVKTEGRIPFVPPASAPLAHPYYWAPFILIGNWR